MVGTRDHLSELNLHHVPGADGKHVSLHISTVADALRAAGDSRTALILERHEFGRHLAEKLPQFIADCTDEDIRAEAGKILAHSQRMIDPKVKGDGAVIA